jgi:hypothetical protein
VYEGEHHAEMVSPLDFWRAAAGMPDWMRNGATICAGYFSANIGGSVN